MEADRRRSRLRRSILKIRSRAPLATVPAGTDIFIDANVFVYGLNGMSAQCCDFLTRCAKEEVTGISLFEIVNEATHKFMLGEARSKHLIPPNGGASALKDQWRVIPTLVDYWRDTERVLALNLLLLSTNEGLVRNAHHERNHASLLTNDSMIISCMRELGIDCLATRDGDFGRANGITIFSPDDI